MIERKEKIEKLELTQEEIQILLDMVQAQTSDPQTSDEPLGTIEDKLKAMLK